MATRSADSSLLARLRFLSSIVLELDHESSPRGDSAWPRPVARRVLSRVASEEEVVLTSEEVVQVAVGIGIPAESLTADPESWRPVESCFHRLIALRAQDERCRAPLPGADEESPPTSSSEPEAYDMDMTFWNAPRCCRGPWSRPHAQDQIVPRRRRGLRRQPVDTTDSSAAAEVLERCASVISDLNESIGHFDGSIRDYLERLEAHRGRPIKMRTFLFRELGGGECGIYIPRRTYDEVGFPLDAPHATHIILHEVGHMVFDHAAARKPEESPLFRSMASITPDALAVYLGRSVYEDRAEREAEAFATFLSSAAASPGSNPEEAGAASDATELRMRTTFGG